ncbi:MAG TPA: hypothetical protein DCR14_11845, partial [Acidimicrobiaceae bacterium]|nr:hypothetical protein [Acidimicrobiaceae bacterium]
MAMSLIDDHEAVVYPESDGQPMGENALQTEVIIMLKIGLDRRFGGRPDAYVGADQFWYPVQGRPDITVAPDAYVVVDLPTVPSLRDRGSYRPWALGGRMMFVSEVLSPSNTWAEMQRKLAFYERYGVDEYWVFDPIDGALEVWVREGSKLVRQAIPADGFQSPHIGVTVTVIGRELGVFDPDGRRWGYAIDEGRRLDDLIARANEEAARANEEAARANEEAARANEEAARAKE